MSQQPLWPDRLRLWAFEARARAGALERSLARLHKSGVAALSPLYDQAIEVRAACADLEEIAVRLDALAEAAEGSLLGPGDCGAISGGTLHAHSAGEPWALPPELERDPPADRLAGSGLL